MWNKHSHTHNAVWPNTQRCTNKQTNRQTSTFPHPESPTLISRSPSRADVPVATRPVPEGDLRPPAGVLETQRGRPTQLQGHPRLPPKEESGLFAGGVKDGVGDCLREDQKWNGGHPTEDRVKRLESPREAPFWVDVSLFVALFSALSPSLPQIHPPPTIPHEKALFYKVSGHGGRRLVI